MTVMERLANSIVVPVVVLNKVEDAIPTARSGKILGGTPMNRYLDASELLGATLFLCDDRAASAITGIVLPIDGGFSAYSGV